MGEIERTVLELKGKRERYDIRSEEVSTALGMPLGLLPEIEAGTVAVEPAMLKRWRAELNALISGKRRTQRRAGDRRR